MKLVLRFSSIACVFSVAAGCLSPGFGTDEGQSECAGECDQSVGDGTTGASSSGGGGIGRADDQRTNKDAPAACIGPALPPVTDYGAPGPFAVTRILNTGPNNAYTMFRPTTLGGNGFKHPPASWGGTVSVTPPVYEALLNRVASHGFVVIATNSSTSTAALLTQGLNWLITQNGVAGALQGKIAVNCGVTLGHGLGGASAVTAGNHPNVVATVSLHGLAASANNIHGSLLLVTSTNDTFVVKSTHVVPTYNSAATAPTLMATLQATGPNGHFIPLGDAGLERAPLIAWLRYWAYGDQGAETWFDGASCKVCQSPWLDVQRKNHSW